MSDRVSETSPQDFDFATLPWLDRGRDQIDRYVRSLRLDDARRFELRAHLVHWMQFGFVVFERAIDPALVDALLKDVDDLLGAYRSFRIQIDCDLASNVPITTLEEHHVRDLREDRGAIHVRLNDLHNYSTAAKKLSLHRSIVDFLGHVFRAPVVAMQSLFFFKGSEQEAHQDFAFVRSTVASELAASWIALEDVDPGAGPLVYIPGSHALPKFEWGDGMFRTNKSRRTTVEFAEFLHAAADRYRQEALRFCPKKGDVFIWHGALAHGGSPATNRELTRKSYVTHYSNADHHRHDHRAPKKRAKRIEINGAFIHQSPVDPKHEDVLRNGGALP